MGALVGSNGFYDYVRKFGFGENGLGRRDEPRGILNPVNGMAYFVADDHGTRNLGDSVANALRYGGDSFTEDYSCVRKSYQDIEHR